MHKMSHNFSRVRTSCISTLTATKNVPLHVYILSAFEAKMRQKRDAGGTEVSVTDS